MKKNAIFESANSGRIVTRYSVSAKHKDRSRKSDGIGAMDFPYTSTKLNILNTSFLSVARGGTIGSPRLDIALLNGDYRVEEVSEIELVPCQDRRVHKTVVASVNRTRFSQLNDCRAPSWRQPAIFIVAHL